MSAARAAARQRLRRHLLRATGLALRARERRTDGPPPTRNLLLLRPDHLGDVLWLTPALHGLRARYPEARITVAIGPWGEPALANNPDCDELLTIAFPGFERRPKESAIAPYSLLRDTARALRQHDFDTAIVLRDDHWWGALLAATAGIPRRFGFAQPDVAPFLTDALPLRHGEHAGFGNLVLIDAVLAAARRPPVVAAGATSTEAAIAHPLRFFPTAQAEERAATLLAPLSSDGADRPIVAIHPSAGVPVKLWDEGRLAAVADRLVDECGARIILTGSRGDEPLTGAVAARMRSGPPLDLTGRTDVETLVALYRRCALVLGPDGGALHLAVAAGAPTIHLYGPADPIRFGPWGDPARQVVVAAGMRCARCGDLSPSRPRGAACMMAIGVADVLAPARRLLGAAAAR